MADNEMLTALTAEITAVFLANNHVEMSEIVSVIGSVHAALSALGKAPELEVPEIVPAVSVRKSLADPTKIISMIDGKSHTMLKRHLAQHGLTPAEYRARYNLPADYPMTAPAYSERRKALALKIGFGRKPKVVEVAPKPAAPTRGRRKLSLAQPVADATTAAPKAPRKPRATSVGAITSKGR